jgi:hypothetical protein
MRTIITFMMALIVGITNAFAVDSNSKQTNVNQSKGNVEYQISNELDRWKTAFDSHSIENILNLYASNAILQPTLSSTTYLSNEKREMYFNGLFKQPEIAVAFHTQHIEIYHDTIAIAVGDYDFTYIKDGKKVTLPSRYTFVYSLEPTGWAIVFHHSSVQPK